MSRSKPWTLILKAKFPLRFLHLQDCSKEEACDKKEASASRALCPPQTGTVTFFWSWSQSSNYYQINIDF